MSTVMYKMTFNVVIMFNTANNFERPMCDSTKQDEREGVQAEGEKGREHCGHVQTLNVCEPGEGWGCDSLIKLKGFCCGGSDLHLELSWPDVY